MNLLFFLQAFWLCTIPNFNVNNAFPAPDQPIYADLPDLVISEIKAGNYLIEQDHVPITYTITNKGTGSVKLGKVEINASWANQGSDEPVASSCVRLLVLKFSGEEEKVLSPGKSFTTTLDAMVPEKGLKRLPMVPAPDFNPRGTMDLIVHIDPIDKIKELREYNNIVKVPVNFNIRDHRN